MNRATVAAEGLPLPPWAEQLESFACQVMDLLGKDAWDLSILVCNNEAIRRYNAEYRAQDEPTDVLSFSLGSNVEEGGEVWHLPGDIAISLETLWENAAYFQVSADKELQRLVIHGILHLDGMDHQSNEADEPMLREQERLLDRLAACRILPP